MALLRGCCLFALAAAAFAATVPSRRSRQAQDDLPPSCDSQVYCQGELLHAVQLASVFNDSKTFVDLKQRQPPAQTLANFAQFVAQFGSNASRDDLAQFVQDNFEEGSELEAWTPPDWQQEPQVLSRIADAELREWAQALNDKWQTLARRVSEDVLDNSDLYSLIYVPNGFIIPGGRFREYYYWDSYWIVQGLLVTDMPETVRGMLENFLYLVATLGHVPNGGRLYYEQRSQPPLLIPMVNSLVEYCASAGCEYLQWLADSVTTLDAEFDFWITNRLVDITVGGRTYSLGRYNAPSLGPRPESYREDYLKALSKPDDAARQQLYIDFKSTAEAGLDFSSRWFISNSTNEGNITDTQTHYIIPVELNAILCGNARLLASFHQMLGDTEKVTYYTEKLNEFSEAINTVLWNEDLGVWLDYDSLNGISRNYFYPTNLAPLWTACYDQSNLNIEKILSYLRNNIFQYSGGIPASLYNTGEQWDLPNAWPPLQEILITGLRNTGDPAAASFAYGLAQEWIHANYKGYETYNMMFEKYDAENPGEYGGGGEYTVQDGFGWTNGVVLQFLNEYGQNLTAHSSDTETRSWRRNWH